MLFCCCFAPRSLSCFVCWLCVWCYPHIQPSAFRDLSYSSFSFKLLSFADARAPQTSPKPFSNVKCLRFCSPLLLLRFLKPKIINIEKNNQFYKRCFSSAVARAKSVLCKCYTHDCHDKRLRHHRISNLLSTLY